MPFLDHALGRIYYQHWSVAAPRAAVIFLHGFGEHTGLYDRYGSALNAAGIDLWAVDQLGHGQSPGVRGQLGTLEDGSALAEELTKLAEQAHPGIPLVAQGHSYGAVVTLFRLLENPDRYRAGIISGAPLVPIPELVNLNTSMDLDPAGLSTDPFFLDLIENDPLAFTSADSRNLTRELDRGWDRFGAELPALTVPTLAVHGAIDPIAAPGAVRAYADQIPALQYREFAETRHDVLNDTTHAEVTAAIVEFIDRATG
jgi:alpha-beta hydrolase superfamily lysophospholipase